ncbi:MAG: type II toxin-antitoxin system RelE/ParE family toxin [Ginsengibacter sp.]
MHVIFGTLELEQLYLIPVEDIKGKLPFQKSIIQKYKNRIVLLESIEKLTDLYSFKSLHFEKLKGDKAGQSSIRLNNRYRLIIEKVNDEVIKILIVEISKHYD